MFTDTSKPTYRRPVGYALLALFGIAAMVFTYRIKSYGFYVPALILAAGFGSLALIAGWSAFKTRHQRELGRKYLPLRRRVAMQSCCMLMVVCGVLLTTGMVGLFLGNKEIVQAVGGFFVLASVIPFITMTKEVYLGKTPNLKWIE